MLFALNIFERKETNGMPFKLYTTIMLQLYMLL